MKRLVLLLLSAVLPCVSGCVTASLVSDAKGSRCIDQEGKVVQVTAKPKPALYLLTPLTVGFDVASTPFGVAAWIITGVNPFEGMFEPSLWRNDCYAEHHVLQHPAGSESQKKATESGSSEK
jgi:hypothetical protein